jgi:MYXO-CTERM domain-containing protein
VKRPSGSRLAATLTVASVLSLLSSAAWAQPHGTQPGTLRAPLEPAGRCTECHAGETTAAGRTYMAGDAWAPSMMANAARDPLFLATLTVANQQAPGVGTTCFRCHSPSGFTSGRAANGFGTDLDPVLGDTDGVHCDTCHRSVVPAADPNAPYLSNAQLTYSDAPVDGLPTRYGPRNDPATSPRHPSMGSPFLRDARLCGQCHNVDHPSLTRLAPDQQNTGAQFPLQSTYAEWAQSDFARLAEPQTCQTCHMPEVGGDPLPSTRIPDAPARPGQRRHDFLGGNEWGPALLRAAFPGELDAEFDAARAATQASLRSAATVTFVEPPATGAAGSTARVRVRITNNTGHKLPTGYEDARQIWVQVRVGGRVVSGAFVDDELVRDAQARVYEFDPGHVEGGRVVHSDFVAQHTVVISDTRIPPRGMRPDARTAPVGRDYAGGEPVTVRLLYRATTKHYVETIAAANTTDNRGRELLRLFNASGRAAPYEMATVSTTVHVTAAAAPGDDGGGCRVGPGAAKPSGAWAFGLALALVPWAARRRRRGATTAR